MNVPEKDEEPLVGTGSHWRLFGGQLDWPGISDLAPVSRCPPSATQDDETFMELPGDYAHYPPDYLPPNDLPGVPQFFYMDVATSTTTGSPDVGDSYSNSPGGYQDHTELVGGLGSGPSRSDPTFDGRGHFPTGRPVFLPVPRYPEDALLPSALDPLPQTPSDETDVTGDTSPMVVPLSDDHPSIPTPPFSSPGSYSGESGGCEAFSPMMEIRGSTWDSGTAATPLGTMTTFSSSFTQTPGLHSYSYSSRDEAAPSSGHRDRQLSNTASSTSPSNRATARRNSKYRCNILGCSSTFAQKQGLNRHMRDKHSQWRPCPYCKDFEWSEGRFYLLKKHLMKVHPKLYSLP